jgi:hypothetical protein
MSRGARRRSSEAMRVSFVVVVGGRRYPPSPGAVRPGALRGQGRVVAPPRRVARSGDDERRRRQQGDP